MLQNLIYKLGMLGYNDACIEQILNNDTALGTDLDKSRSTMPLGNLIIAYNLILTSDVRVQSELDRGVVSLKPAAFSSIDTRINIANFANPYRRVKTGVRCLGMLASYSSADEVVSSVAPNGMFTTLINLLVQDEDFLYSLSARNIATLANLYTPKDYDDSDDREVDNLRIFLGAVINHGGSILLTDMALLTSTVIGFKNRG